jgi:hypothetical protein
LELCEGVTPNHLKFFGRIWRRHYESQTYNIGWCPLFVLSYFLPVYTSTLQPPPHLDAGVSTFVFGLLRACKRVTSVTGTPSCLPTLAFDTCTYLLLQTTVDDILALREACGLSDNDVAEALRERAARIYEKWVQVLGGKMVFHLSLSLSLSHSLSL